jgi:hypothetical protein
MTFLLSNAPPGRPSFIPENQETKEAATARYESIAKDIYEVVRDEPPLFGGKNAKARTAAVLLSVAYFESGFNRNVDFGLGKLARGDNGNSWCLTQQNVGKGKTIAWNPTKNRYAKYGDPVEEVEQGWTGVELVTDRKKCLRVALRGIRASFRSCQSYPLVERLRSYGSGTCEKGKDASISRMAFAIKWFDQHRPATDDVLFAPVTVPEVKPVEAPPALVSKND